MMTEIEMKQEHDHANHVQAYRKQNNYDKY